MSKAESCSMAAALQGQDGEPLAANHFNFPTREQERKSQCNGVGRIYLLWNVWFVLEPRLQWVVEPVWYPGCGLYYPESPVSGNLARYMYPLPRRESPGRQNKLLLSTETSCCFSIRRIRCGSRNVFPGNMG